MVLFEIQMGLDVPPDIGSISRRMLTKNTRVIPHPTNGIRSYHFFNRRQVEVLHEVLLEFVQTGKLLGTVAESAKSVRVGLIRMRCDVIVPYILRSVRPRFHHLEFRKLKSRRGCYISFFE